jgi:hypothetical protein
MDWKQNKIIFNYISEKKYIIKKDNESNNILFIKYDKFEIKCKYFLAFTVDENNKILWASDNPYIDQKTKFLSNYIKQNINNDNFNNDIMNYFKKIIKNNSFIIYNDQKINFIWCIIGNLKKYKQYYIITEIIYF